MKEKLIQEISTAMAEVLSFEQVAHLNSVLLQVVSQYTITEDGETLHENAVSNDRLLDIFLSAKQVEGCTTPTIKYYGSTIRQLFKKMPKKGNRLHHRGHQGLSCRVPAEEQVKPCNYRQHPPDIFFILCLA